MSNEESGFLASQLGSFTAITTMLAKSIIYPLFDGSLKIPEGEKAALLVEPSLLN